MFIDEFRERLAERMSVMDFARMVPVHYSTIYKWKHTPAWVDLLFDSWDEIDRLRKFAPIGERMAFRPGAILPIPKKERGV